MTPDAQDEEVEIKGGEVSLQRYSFLPPTGGALRLAVDGMRNPRMYHF